MCRVGPVAARRHGGTVVSLWRTRWHGGVTVALQLARWHAGATVAHQVARRHGCSMVVADETVGRCGTSQGGIMARWHGLLVTWHHGKTKGR